mmetsp:Transcript_4716/g.8389  ORF Transcript_4716/g.8389 Transcript_4716/m.8389 type:complete len:85 (-) Transcript_4716:602-856(-)
MPMAKGKLRNIKVEIVEVMIWASNATAPSSPAIIVVISKDHASAEKLSAPETANFQPPQPIKPSLEIAGHTGHVSFNDLLLEYM